MVTRTFPLLALPYLALCVVLDQFRLKEIVHFSLCSKRSQRIASRKPRGKLEITLHAKKQCEFIVSLNNQPTYKFRICGMSRNFLSSNFWKPTPMAGMMVPTKRMDLYTATFWNDAVQGIDKIGTYLTELFKTPITEIHFLSEKNENDTMGIIDSVKRKQNSIGKCTFGQMNYTDRYLTHLLNNLEITDDLNLVAVPSRDFRYVWSLNCVRLTVENGFWLTVDHLLDMTSQYVRIENTSLSNEDLKRFLKHWQNGGCSSLKSLLLESYRFDMDDILEGIQVEEIPDTTSRSYLGHNRETIQMRGGHDIKRSDGTTRTVFPEWHLFRFAVQL